MNIAQQIKSPGGLTPDAINSRVGNVRTSLGLIDKSPQYLLGLYNARTITITPKTRGNSAQIVLPFRNGDGDLSPIVTTGTWTIDLDASTINTTTNTGGRIDGIARESGRDYLIWAFLDSNFQFAGLGVSRKPYSTFTAVSSGTKGATATYTVTNAYQFTIGAKVAVKNDNGTAPFFQWNWGTVSSITNNTTLVVLMDTHADYGTDITGTTNGVIRQWDSFRPYIVATSGQTEYTPNYLLLGEVYTLASNGNIYAAYHVDESLRAVQQFSYTWTVGTLPASGTQFSFGRDLPLWVNNVECYIAVGGAVAAYAVAINGVDIMFFDYPAAWAAGTFVREEGTVMPLYNRGVFTLTYAGGPTNGSVVILVNKYSVSGGMKQ